MQKDEVTLSDAFPVSHKFLKLHSAKLRNCDFINNFTITESQQQLLSTLWVEQFIKYQERLQKAVVVMAYISKELIMKKIEK